jgi:hypothetical protein
VELLVGGLALLGAKWSAPVVSFILGAVHFFGDELIIINRLAIHHSLVVTRGLVTTMSFLVTMGVMFVIVRVFGELGRLLYYLYDLRALFCQFDGDHASELNFRIVQSLLRPSCVA